MKVKIQIKSLFGKVLFELEKENNTVKDTLIEALKSGADLRGADLRYTNLSDANLSDANLSNANLSNANLSGADLYGANLKYTNLRYANLSYANLSYTDLRYADLSNANLSDANYKGLKIKKFICFSNLYKYNSSAIITEDNKYYIELGCHLSTLEEWESDFWNNNREFPNDGSIKSEMRLLAFNYYRGWINLNK